MAVYRQVESILATQRGDDMPTNNREPDDLAEILREQGATVQKGIKPKAKPKVPRTPTEFDADLRDSLEECEAGGAGWRMISITDVDTTSSRGLPIKLSVKIQRELIKAAKSLYYRLETQIEKDVPRPGKSRVHFRVPGRKSE